MAAHVRAGQHRASPGDLALLDPGAARERCRRGSDADVGRLSVLQDRRVEFGAGVISDEILKIALSNDSFIILSIVSKGEEQG
jgi:hypothetical protein